MQFLKELNLQKTKLTEFKLSAQHFQNTSKEGNHVLSIVCSFQPHVSLPSP